jgi:hypothetical protein
MKKIGLLFLLCGVLWLTGCSDQSLLTDEEYKSIKGPAPYSPDPMQHIPVSQNERPSGY